MYNGLNYISYYVNGDGQVLGYCLYLRLLLFLCYCSVSYWCLLNGIKDARKPSEEDVAAEVAGLKAMLGGNSIRKRHRPRVFLMDIFVFKNVLYISL